MKKISAAISKLLLFSLFLASLSCFAQVDSSSTAEIAEISDTIFKRLNYASDNKKQSTLDLLIDSIVSGYMQSPENCALSIGISVKGKITYYNYGEIKRDSKLRPDSSSIYELGSNSETFCGLLLAIAVKEKKLKLEDDIRKYLPEKYPNLNYYGKIIRVKQLANHSSGLARFPENMTTQNDFDKLNPYKNYSKEMLLSYLNTVKLKDEPGTAFEYSPLGISLLGMILEKVYNKPYEELLKEKILLPYALFNTSLNLPESQNLKFVSAYNLNGEATPHWEMGIFAPAGGIKSSNTDVMNYLEYNRREIDQIFVMAHNPVTVDKESVGLAWFNKKTKQGKNMIWHNGATYGAASFFAIIKEKECAISILANSASSLDFIGIAILNYLQK